MDLARLAEYAPSMLEGFLTTLEISAATLLLATPVALAIAVLREARIPGLNAALIVLVNLVRLLPAVIVLFLVFYGGPQLGLRFDPMVAAILGLGTMGAAYMSEDIRGGLAAIDQGQYAAARALGMSPARTFRRVILPQALPLILPPYMTRAIIMVKGSSLASMIAVNDLTAAAARASSITYDPFTFIVTAGVLYLAVSGALVLFQGWAEARLRRRYRLYPKRV
ncbi:MAG: nickel transporter [Rhodovulum sulfidophilum]|uniref:Nickel transporter n=1 Tax=Rhodovulum sulfidophilum TaxID=35806 RepID=A0A2W5N3C0_RHOSU|nr:MAG: nickel transporter [Rhodovulum sulfidophilum]